MKTIIILVDQFYFHGGIEKLVSIKANYWTDKFGYKVIIVSTEQQNNPKVYELSKNVKFIDLKINYHRGISFFHPRNLNKLILNYKKIKRILTDYHPDFILVASHIPMTYLLPFINTNTKIIKEFHFSKFNRSLSKKEKFFQFIESKYDYLIVLSDEEKSFYPSKNVITIPNPVIRLQEIDTITLKNKPKIAAAILRFAPVKQLDKMIEIWADFYQTNKDWKLYFYGETEGKYFKTIQKIVKDKRLEGTILFKGQTNDVYKALKEVRVLLMTSSNECFPMVILEANACGVPVISFDSPTGPRNIINHNIDGKIIPLNNINVFSENLNELAQNDELRIQMSLNAFKNAEKYQLEKVMNTWKNKIFEKQ